jgi:hypothetical protein
MKPLVGYVHRAVRSPRNGGDVFRYRLHSPDGDDLGEAIYAVMIKPDEEIIAGNNERFRVLNVVPVRGGGVADRCAAPGRGRISHCGGPARRGAAAQDLPRVVTVQPATAAVMPELEAGRGEPPLARRCKIRAWPCGQNVRSEFQCRATCLVIKRGGPVETTLIERVEELIQAASRARPEWGSPHLSATPTAMRIDGLAAQFAALEEAMREIALEVEKLSARDSVASA